MKRIAAIGTINRDTIHTPDGVVTESYGGLLYTVLALASLAEPGTIIYPICNVGEDIWTVAMDLLGRSEQIHVEGVRKVPTKNNHVTISYDERGNKAEILSGGVPPLQLEDIAPFLDSDAICLNFISGFELTLQTLQQIRSFTSGVGARRAVSLLMDFHSLSLGRTAQGRRFFRKPANSEAWIRCVDVVQMNEQEASLLAERELEGEDAWLGFGREVLSLGPKALSITLGEQGSRLVFHGTSEPMLEFFPPLPIQALDTTGCGDVFLAGFALEYLRSHDLRRASRLANHVAGLNCTLRGVEETARLGDLLSARCGRYNAPFHFTAEYA